MLHDRQKILLKRLHVQNGLRYGELTRGYDYEDNVVFHLKQLIDKEFVVKKDGVYALTANGVKEITSYDLTSLTDPGFKTLMLGLLCNYQDKYLIKEHPQAKQNFYNLPSGKPIFGEDVKLALSKTFNEYTSLKIDSANFSFLSFHLKTIKTSDQEILFDDPFAIYRITLNSSQFHEAILTNMAIWKSKEEIAKLPNRWPELDYCILKEIPDSYLAYEFISDYILI